MASFSSSVVSVRIPKIQPFSGSSLMQVDQPLSSTKLFVSTTSQGKAKSRKYRKPLMVQARRDDGRPSGTSIFVSGFVLGGVVVGALGCIYAPQISTVLLGEILGDERRELLKKLPKFVYDDKKDLENTRKLLSKKVAQLTAAVDELSEQYGKKSARQMKLEEEEYLGLC